MNASSRWSSRFDSRRTASHPIARYIAPVSRKSKPRRSATIRATDDFPVPAGPSIVMIKHCPFHVPTRRILHPLSPVLGGEGRVRGPFQCTYASPREFYPIDHPLGKFLPPPTPFRSRRQRRSILPRRPKLHE